MMVNFRILSASNILIILPLLYELNEGKVSKEVLEKRILEMSQQNYECLGVFYNNLLIGVCGMWFQTRHYAGKSCEIDHVFIKEQYRSQGIGGELLKFIYDYVDKKGCNWVELNTYIDNIPSHKFYDNHDFTAKGYHFVKDITV